MPCTVNDAHSALRHLFEEIVGTQPPRDVGTPGRARRWVLRSGSVGRGRRPLGADNGTLRRPRCGRHLGRLRRWGIRVGADRQEFFGVRIGHWLLARLDDRGHATTVESHPSTRQRRSREDSHSEGFGEQLKSLVQRGAQSGAVRRHSSWRSESQLLSHHPTQPPHRGDCILRLRTSCGRSRVPDGDCVRIQGVNPWGLNGEAAVLLDAKIEELKEAMDARWGDALRDKQCLEVLLGALLAVEAHRIGQRIATSPAKVDGGLPVVLGLVDPVSDACHAGRGPFLARGSRE